MKKLLYLLCTLSLVASMGVYPAGRTCKGTAVSNNTIRTIQTFLTLDPAHATAQEFQQKQMAAAHAIQTLPVRLRAQYQVEFAKKQGTLINPATHTVVQAKPSRKLPVTVQQPKVSAKPVAKASPKKPVVQDEDESSGLSLVGTLGTIALILAYEFVIAPKLGTTQLGIADFCKAIYNKQNPLAAQAPQTITAQPTAQPQPAQPSTDPAVVQNGAQPEPTDTTTQATTTPVQSTPQPATQPVVAQSNEQQHNEPGFLKRFGFDIFLSFLGL